MPLCVTPLSSKLRRKNAGEDMPEDKTGVTVPLTGGELGTCVGVVGLC